MYVREEELQFPAELTVYDRAIHEWVPRSASALWLNGGKRQVRQYNRAAKCIRSIETRVTELARQANELELKFWLDVFQSGKVSQRCVRSIGPRIKNLAAKSGRGEDFVREVSLLVRRAAHYHWALDRLESFRRCRSYEGGLYDARFLRKVVSRGGLTLEEVGTSADKIKKMLWALKKNSET